MSGARTSPGAGREPGDGASVPDKRRRGLLGLGRPRGGIEVAVRRVFAAAPTGASADERGRFWQAWRGTLRLLRPLGAVSEGNRIDVYSDGDRAFEAMWDAIAAARSRVWLNTYTLEPDRVGRRTLDRLVQAAERGCRVILVYDRVGSFRLSESDLAPLRAAGATILAYNPVFRLWTGFSRLVRNHRKILIADDVGFCGGMNVAEEYAGERYGSGFFRDTHLRAAGPCVRDLARLVAQIVGEMTRRMPRWFEAPARCDDGSLVQILESNVRRERRAIQKALRYTVIRSVDRCYLTTPYFVPPRRLMRALRGAARRGVDVRVLTAGRSDVPLVHLASQHLYGRLLRAGVRIYEMWGRTLHAKTATIDGVYASVGSFNLDHWSDRRNLEVNLTVLDRRTARDIEQRFRSDLELSREVELVTWTKRGALRKALHWVAYQVARF